MRYNSKIIAILSVAMIVVITGCLGSGGSVQPFEEIDHSKSDYSGFTQLEEIQLNQTNDQVQVAMGEDEKNIHVQVRNLVPTGGYKTNLETVHINDESELQVVFVSESPSDDESVTQAVQEIEKTVSIDKSNLGDGVETVTVTLHDGWGNLHVVDFERN